MKPDASAPVRVLVIDSDAERRGRVAAAVSRAGAEPCAEAAGCPLALVAVEERASLPGLGPEKRRVIAYANDADRWTLAARCRLLLAGAADLIGGPRLEADLFEALRRELASLVVRAAGEAALASTMAGLGFVAASPQMLDLFRQIVRVSALTDLPVIITGETGTGKQLIAEALHRLDQKRRGGPFVAVNCGAIAASLAEAELFGHRRGAFTGADRDRRGLVRAADGGVLFLDELGELEPAVQAKLLRVLQEQRVLALGDERETSVSVRIIAATNRDLRGAVEQGAFRQDLFQRLSAVALHLPPLCERRADVPALVAHFLVKHRALSRAEPRATAEFVEALAALPLPGNVRQLENLVRGAIVCADDEPLSLRHLPPDVWSRLSQAAPAAPEPAGQNYVNALLDEHPGNLAAALQTCERAILEAALARAAGNQARTARMLGITPRGMYNKLRRHHLSA